MVLRIGSNHASLQAQRRLGNTTEAIATSYERLGSGLRINRASDDPAGLAVSSALRANSRVFAQALRNINDGLSLLSVGEGALVELSSLTTRQLELAEQAANGSYSAVQRKALDEEAQALQQEFGRVVASTSLNGVKLLNGSLPEGVRIQVGYGTEESLIFGLGSSLMRLQSSGSFATRVSYSANANNTSLAAADFNGDGKLDLATGDNAGWVVNVHLGNGDGSFLAKAATVVGGSAEVVSHDMNRDGFADLTLSTSSGEIRFLRGLGNGTFAPAVVFQNGTQTTDLNTLDANGDGITDLVTVNDGDNTASILLGNGDGSYKARYSFATGNDPRYVGVADFNSDGSADLIVSDLFEKTISMYLGNGDGTYRARVTSPTYNFAGEVRTGDFNGDGKTDLANSVVYAGGIIETRLGNGDGSFKASTTYSTGVDCNELVYTDLTGDGIADLAAATENSVLIMAGNGDGTFKAAKTFAAPAGNHTLMVADLNADGVSDLVAGNFTTPEFGVYLGVGTATSTATPIDLKTQSSARGALETLKGTRERITAELGAIGAAQSRLLVAANNVRTMREYSLSAASRITDADMAAESANLVQAQIRRETGAAILAQANQSPALALSLLN